MGTHDRLVNLELDACCLLCRDHNHLFFSCVVSKDIWTGVKDKMDTMTPSIGWNPFIQWISTNWAGNSFPMRVRKLGLSMAIYCIWEERNRRFHTGSCASVNSIIAHVLDTIRGRLNTYTQIQDNSENWSIQQRWSLAESIFSP